MTNAVVSTYMMNASVMLGFLYPTGDGRINVRRTDALRSCEVSEDAGGGEWPVSWCTRKWVTRPDAK